MSADELAEALIAARGSYTADPARLPLAIGLVRAAVEAELSRGGDSRVAIRRFRTCDIVLVGQEPDDPAAETTAADLLDHAVALGQRGARMAAADPLLTRQRAIEELRTLRPPDGALARSDQRLLQLAATASASEAALSSQGQLYPVGMAAARALRYAAGALTGHRVSIETVQAQVRARFPLAKPLPDRPALDGLLKEAGSPLVWDGIQRVYVQPTFQSSTTTASRLTTSLAPLAGVAAIAEIDARLTEAIERRGFLAVLAPLRAADEARRALLARHELYEVDVTAVMLDRLGSLGFPWEAITAADTGNLVDANFRGLVELVQHHVVPAIAKELADERPILITEAAPLARYGQLRLLQELADPTRPRPAARFLLLPARRAEPVMLDQEQVPITSPTSQSLWLPEIWIRPTSEKAARQ
jgi:hypothetical protein